MIKTTGKIGLAIICHESRLRPNGVDLAIRAVNSLVKSNITDIEVFMVDNGSDGDFSHKFQMQLATLNVQPTFKINWVKIHDQSILGITGAWNKSLKTMYDAEHLCGFIISNDDVVFNPSFQNLIYQIQFANADEIYGPLTNGVYYPSAQLIHNDWEANHESNKIVDVPDPINNPLNGFCFGFSRQHYGWFRNSVNEYFPVNHKYNGGDGKYGGQEGYFSYLTERHNVRQLIDENTFIWHQKIRGWKQLVTV